MAQNQPNRKTKSNTIMTVSVIVGAVVGVSVSQLGIGGKNYFLLCLVLLLAFMVLIGWIVVTSMKKIPKATQEEDREAKKFIPVSDKGVVYIFRDQFIAMAKAFPVMISGQSAGWVKGKRLLRLELPAGQYTLGGDKACKESTEFTIENGQIIFIEQEVVAGALKGGYAYNILEDSQSVRTRITQCRLTKVT